MSIHFMSNEELIWKSFPGVRYRSFIFARDFSLFIFFAILFYYGVDEFIPGFLSDKVLLSLTFSIGGIGLIFAGITQIQFLLVRYYLTSERLIIKRGFFNRNLTSIKLEHVHDTKIVQSFSERLIGTGSIYLFTANDSKGADGEDVLHRVPAIKNIDDPFLVHQKVEEMVERNTHQ